MLSTFYQTPRAPKTLDQIARRIREFDAALHTNNITKARYWSLPEFKEKKRLQHELATEFGRQRGWSLARRPFGPLSLAAQRRIPRLDFSQWWPFDHNPIELYDHGYSYLAG